MSLKRCKIGPKLLWRLIGNRIRAFDWYQNQWPWMTLNGRNATLAEINKSRAIAWRTARCRCKFWYVSNFTTASCSFSATAVTARLSCIHHTFWKLTKWKCRLETYLWDDLRIKSGNVYIKFIKVMYKMILNILWTRFIINLFIR